MSASKDDKSKERFVDWSFDDEAEDARRVDAPASGPAPSVSEAEPAPPKGDRSAPAVSPPPLAPSTSTISTDGSRLSAWLAGGLGLGPGQSPFPWQVELLERFRRGDLPRALDVPTGLGKTSVIAIWLAARAAGAPVPRRLVYVVDRRAVVDQATTVAEALRAYVDATDDLKQTLGLGSRSLPISTLRGQYLDNREWLEDPSAPAIVVGTVDMMGSRLLFGGYGVSTKMRPYHAGFLGADTLIVLDEAHLVPPFERLIEAVEAADENGLGPAPAARNVVPPVRLLSLSATGRSSSTALTLGDADRAHPVVKERIHARKVIVIRDGAAKSELAKHLAEEAHALGTRGGARRILVFCDTRDDAKKVLTALEKLAGKQSPTQLFVGGRRAFERAEVAGWLERHGFVAGKAAAVPLSTSAYLIATSAAEVGVDLDADDAVGDVVAWERTVQRLGRVNRRGKNAAAVVLVPLSDAERDPDRRTACLALLGRLSTIDGGYDGSPAALGALRARASTEPEIADLLERATTPAPLHPPLTRPLLDAWAMTSLDVHPGRPEVAPWLRGWIEEEEPRTTIVFRQYLPIVEVTRARNGSKVLDAKNVFDEAMLEAFLEAAGPHAAEMLETETWRALAWLDARVEEVCRRNGDLANGPHPWAVALGENGDLREVITNDVLRNKRRRPHLERDLQGATLLVDARLGGLSSGLLDDDVDAAVARAADPSADAEDTSSAPAEQEAAAIVFGVAISTLDLTDPDSPAQRAGMSFRIRRVLSLSDDAPPQQYRVDEAFVAARDADGTPAAWFVVERAAGEVPVSEAGRSVAGREQALDEHQAWVEREADTIASRLGLEPALARALRIAARLHDEGKKAERWQRAFHVPANKRPLAKSRRAPNVALLGGYRHELGSLPRMERDPELLALDAELRDVALHLVAAHHGRARPVLPVDGAEEPPTRLRERAREIALRFDRLSRRYGPWGLAWLESLLRAADQRASKKNDEVTRG